MGDPGSHLLFTTHTPRKPLGTSGAPVLYTIQVFKLRHLVCYSCGDRSTGLTRPLSPRPSPLPYCYPYSFSLTLYSLCTPTPISFYSVCLSFFQDMAVDSIRVTSLNAKGLNNPEKRRMLLRDLKKSHADVAFIQETHFKNDRLDSSSVPPTHRKHIAQILHNAKLSDVWRL